MPTLEQSVRHHLKYNLIVNLLDGGFYGLGWGFGSLGTVVTLLVSHLTNSALLIGLIPAIHVVGWQLPQLFMANRTARLRRYKPLVMGLTVHERLPFLGLAVVAYFLDALGPLWALVLTFLLLIWQGLGAGLTANPWQNLIAKIIPPDWRGTFFGAQASVVNILMSLSAVGAGLLLKTLDRRVSFPACFLLCLTGLVVSYLFIGLTREPLDEEKAIPLVQPPVWEGGLLVLRRDPNFLAFLSTRVLTQFATMGFSFYILYGLRRFGMNELTAGFLTAALTISQTFANTAMGWLGDRLGHRWMLIVGALATVLSALLAWAGPSLGWLFPAFILAGFSNVAYWTNGMAMTTEFGDEHSRPVYIGLSNTLVAPFSFLAPLLGGWIADTAGFPVTFLLSAVGGLVIAVLLGMLVREPRPRGALKV